MTFYEELRDLINRHSLENTSNTPDYVLAKYMIAVLEAYEVAIIERRSLTTTN